VDVKLQNIKSELPNHMFTIKQKVFNTRLKIQVIDDEARLSTDLEQIVQM
jgi:hypothetical protein